MRPIDWLLAVSPFAAIFLFFLTTALLNLLAVNSRENQRLRAALRDELAAAATYRLWLERPVDELRTQPTNRPDPGE